MSGAAGLIERRNTTCSRDMANLQELQTKVETKIKTFHLAARENQRIIKRDKNKELQQHLKLFEKISRDEIQSTRDDDRKQRKRGSY